MPRFFFDVRDGVDLPDDEGIELADLAAAQVAAARLIGRTLQDHAEKFWSSSRELRVTCRSESGPIFTIVTVTD